MVEFYFVFIMRSKLLSREGKIENFGRVVKCMNFEKGKCVYILEKQSMYFGKQNV
ncbi:hypothetical protein KFK09_011532 [Dendrobium nobile]|uniref:Uncharacterized protein n=1 Tax=Dendrobium nobile TaxID=94219 RepID=A0A8T3BG24_DENNO|nr:hypothetical protein KFK09_011532 [Dendrobium nobile]